MKWYIHWIISILMSFGFSSCNLIDDESLEAEIRQAFEKERRNEVENCEVYIKLPGCIFTNQCSFEIQLYGVANGYKYFFTDEPCSESEIYTRAERLYYNEGEEYNYVTTTISPTGKKKYLYVIAYRDQKTCGDYATYSFNTLSGTQFNEIVNILDLKRSGDIITWSIAGSSYSCRYVIITGSDAEFASKLPDTALALYMNTQDQYYKPRSDFPTTYEFTTTESPIMIVTRAYNGDNNSLALIKQYTN